MTANTEDKPRESMEGHADRAADAPNAGSSADGSSADGSSADGSSAAISRVTSESPERLLTDYRLRQRDYLLRIARAMNARRGLPDVLQLVIKSAVRMTNGEAGAIAMRPAAGGDMQIVASYRLEGRFEHDLDSVIGSSVTGSYRGGSGETTSPDEDPLAGPRAAESSDADVRKPMRAASGVGEITIGSAAPFSGTGVNRGGGSGGDSGGGSTSAASSAVDEDESYDMLTLPLELKDETVGQIIVFRTEGAAAFTPLDTEVLQAFADQAAVAVRNAHLHDQLAARERQLTEVVERNPSGIALAAADGVVVALNPAASALLGRDSDNAVGQPLVHLLTLEGDAGDERPLSLPHGGATTSTRGYVRLPGDVRGPFVQVAVRGLCGPGRVIDSFLADIVDLSAFKESEDAKTAFLAGLSHELKTPLALIQGYAETLQLPAVQDDRSVVDEALNVILDEAEHLNEMVDELLLAARLQSGALRLDFDLVDVGDMLAHLVEAFGVAHSDRTWRLTVADGLPPIAADAVRIRQVFQNLLSNAAKYTSAGATISVIASIEGEHVSVAVNDDGLGIAPEDHARVFDRFVRVTDHGEGAGLGLWMSKTIVEAHGGVIEVESDRGEGSTFTVSLPFQPVVDQPHAEATTDEPEVPTGCDTEPQEDLG